MAQEQYEHDWEDPRFAAEGFVTDYIVHRLAKDNLEWHEAPDIPENADDEHTAMREMCDAFEERNGKELAQFSEDLNKGPLTYAAFCEVMEQFGRTETDIPNEMTFGRMVGLIAFAGVICVQKAINNERRSLALIALYTSKYIESRIKLTWVDAMRSWASFMVMYGQFRHRLNRPRPNPPPPAPVPVPARRPSLLQTITSRRASLIIAASVVGVGAFVAGRALLKSH